MVFKASNQVSGNGTCENLESWCDAAMPNCQESFVREKCQKYCGLCPGKLNLMFIF